MNTPIGEALLLTLVMGAVIFFCRACPFLFFRKSGKGAGANGTDDTARGEITETGDAINGKHRKAAFIDFVEKNVPPLAMTVLTFNIMASPIHENFRETVPVLTAAVFTAVVHLWRRNPLISIFGGTAVYMALERIVF